MALDLEQIKQAIEKPSKKSVIQKASNLQRRLRFHSESELPQSVMSTQANEFLSWVKGILPLDKYNIFVHLFRSPIPTVSTVEDVYQELERVFDSRNASSTYQFSSTELSEDWVKYRRERLSEPNIWRSEGWKRMQVSPNSILVVDLPAEQSTERPEPYFYWLEIEDVIDYSAVNHVDFEWLIFKQAGNRVAVFDDTTIRVFQLDDKNKISGLVSESAHGLGFCPARFFWTSSLNENNRDIKKNPITKKLADLDWLLFFSLSKRHLDTYAPYPIYSAYEAECDFRNNETDEYCDGGFLRTADGSYKMLANGMVEQCPCCSQKRVVGPGSFVEVPIPNQAEGVSDMRNPIQITSIDKDSLEYNVKECERLKNEIIVSIVGSGGTVSEKEAINETQVAANFEGKTSVLNALKTNFELAQKFVEDTVCKLRYGKAFISSSISWGTEFYVFTAKELYTKYAEAKKNGASVAELDAIFQQILEVEHKNNPLMLQRMLVLKQLEPYPHMNLDELIRTQQAGFLNTDLLQLKLNFNTYIDRFERENINILEFATNRPMYERIRIINEKLLDYVKQNGVKPGTGDGAQTQIGGSQGAANEPQD